jgi:hypothetical protein
MEINSIDELVKLAGLVKQQELATEAEVEEDCGCDDTAQASVAVNSPDMYAILQRLAQMGEVHEDEIVDEWANTPDQTGEPEARVMDLPKGEPVDTSLRRYLGANGQPVKVEEAIQDHTVEEMMEAYESFKTEAVEEVTEEDVIEATSDEAEDQVEESAVEEADVEEDNAFNTAAANAKKAGKSEFEFNGKKYKVKMDAQTADALTDDINILKQLAGL